MRTTNTTTILTATILIAMIILIAPQVRAELKLDNIQFDPTIISSGDRVDIVVQFHDTGSIAFQDYIGNPEYSFKVTMLPDDSLTKEYVLIEDSEGNDLQGIITRGGYYNKRFRVKVNDNAPAGDYEFKLIGQWYKDNAPVGPEQYLRFMMPVKKEGIALSIANVLSTPEKVRSGDKNILLTTTLTNTGEKMAKNVRISLNYPDGISSSYTNNNDLNVGVIDAGSNKPVQFYIDTQRAIKEGLYNIGYKMTYEDTDNNGYQTTGSFDIMVKKKPDMTVVQSEGSGTSGSDITLKVVVKNQGEETADAVDVRILKQSSQPFDMDVRSDYLGQLKPGESGTAVFTISAKDDAGIKDHKLSVIIRAKGDSAEGDDNIYTYTDSATISITGKKPNNYPLYEGIFIAAVVVIAIIVNTRKKKK